MNGLVRVMPVTGWEGLVSEKEKPLTEYVADHISHHINQALAVVNGQHADPDAIAWLETSNDPFAGLIVTKTAICLGAEQLLSWVVQFERESSPRRAARLLACVAFVTSLGMFTSKADKTAQGSLGKACELLEQCAGMEDDEKQTWRNLEYCCCAAFIVSTPFQDPVWAHRRDRAVVLGQDLRDMSPTALGNLGALIQVTASCCCSYHSQCDTVC